MIIAYDATTGEIKGQCLPPSPEQAAQWQAAGLAILETQATADPATQKVVEGAIVAKSAAELLSLAQSARYDQLGSDYRGYLVARGYDLNWRDSAREIRDMAHAVLTDPAASQARQDAAQQIVDRLAALSAWMMGTLMGYFAQVGGAIFAAADAAELDAVAWDWSQFDASDPGVTLGGEILPLLATAQGASPCRRGCK